MFKFQILHTYFDIVSQSPTMNGENRQQRIAGCLIEIDTY